MNAKAMQQIFFFSGRELKNFKKLPAFYEHKFSFPFKKKQTAAYSIPEPYESTPRPSILFP